jgi:hypothetical protein
MSDEQRRKIELAGTVILKAIDALPSGQFAAIVRELLDSSLSRSEDRALFDLPPRNRSGGNDAPEGGSPPAAPPIEPERARELKR